MCACSCNATGQIYERMTARKNACVWVSTLMWFVFVASQLLSTTSNALRMASDAEGDARETAAMAVSGVACTIGVAGSVASTYFLCVSRTLLRKRDNIPERECGCTGCEDCCVSYWCQCCSLIQMFKQENVRGDAYRPCTATGV